MAEKLAEFILAVFFLFVSIVLGLKLIAGVVTGDFRLFPKDDDQ